jgi:hypothetical protein
MGSQTVSGMTPTLPDDSAWLSGWPRTRFSDRRARSSLARVVDGVVGLAGAALIGVSLVDAVGTFWHNRVLIFPATLEHLAGALLLPSWPWIMISGLMIFGLPKRDGTRWPRRPRRLANWRQAAPWAAALAVILTVVVIGFGLGAGKGALRVLPGGIHQVSTLDLNSAQWTTVSASEYQEWAARFVREDAFFAFFGMALAGFAAAMQRLRRQLTRQETANLS